MREKKFLKICQELGLKIMNGTINGDKNGEITFIGGKREASCLVLDLKVTLDRGAEAGINWIKIMKRIESDHLPIIFKLSEGM